VLHVAKKVMPKTLLTRPKRKNLAQAPRGSENSWKRTREKRMEVRIPADKSLNGEEGMGRGKNNCEFLVESAFGKWMKRTGGKKKDMNLKKSILVLIKGMEGFKKTKRDGNTLFQERTSKTTEKKGQGRGNRET